MRKEPGLSLDKVLDHVAEYLEHEIEEDRTTAEMSSDALSELKKDVPSPAAPRTGDTTADPSPVGTEEQLTSLSAIAEIVAGCRKCELHETRNQAVPGQGSSNPDIMFVGEAPGADEDRQGLAFVGRAGKLLTKMIEAMGYTRDEVFIGNILKCRPPGNRPPAPDEMETCMPYLKAQIALLRPKVIIAMGATAVKGLLETKVGISKLRGKWMSFEGIDLMPTYHPAYLLRNPSAKHYVWEDLKLVLKHLGKPIPDQSSSEKEGNG